MNSRDRTKEILENLSEELQKEGIDLETIDVDDQLAIYERTHTIMALSRLFFNHRLIQSYMAEKAELLNYAKDHPQDGPINEVEMSLVLAIIGTMLDDLLNAIGFDNATSAAQYLRNNINPDLFKDIEGSQAEEAIGLILGGQ